MKVWSGSAWLDAYASLSGALLATNNLSDLNNTATARTNLGVAIGVNVQAYDQQLADIAGLTPSDNNFIVGNGTNFVTESGSTARTSLGLGSIATQDSSNVTVTGGSINGTTIGASTASTGAFTTLSATGVTTVQAGTVSAPAITTSGDTNTGIFFPAADTIAFTEGGVESMRIDSSGRVGIGTTSPTQQLDVTATSSATSIIVAQNTTATSGGAQLRAGNPQNLFIIGTDSNGGGLTGTANSSFFYTTSTSPIVFMPNATERMRITSGGDLVVGDTTSGGYVISAKKTNDNCLMRLTAVTAGGAGIDLVNAGGSEVSYINGSGNNVLTFRTGGTERMRIDSSGNVGIGTSSPSTKLELNTASSYGGLRIKGTSSASNGFEMAIGSDGVTGHLWLYENSAMRFATNNTERMRITSGGMVGINVTPAAWGGNFRAIQINNGSFSADSTNNTQITHNGYYDGSEWRYISGSAKAINIYFDNSGTINTRTATATGTAGGAISWTDGPYITNGGTSWTNASDEKLKNITGEISDAINKVQSLRAAKFTWKADSTNKSQVGLIAQDLQKALPECVVVPENELNSEGKPTFLGVNYDQVIPLLVASIKELNAKVEAQAAEIALLKSK
jgi:hypothetical protein